MSHFFRQCWLAGTHLVFWAVVLAWVLLAAAWGALHWWIVPRIDDWRPFLERQVSQSLGTTVRIGAIHVRDSGWFPTFALHDVRLIDAEGRVALSLPQTIASISAHSLWRLGFEQLYVLQPELDIRRNAQGQWIVGGLTLSAQPSGDSAVLDWLFAQREFVIHQGTVRWNDELRGAAPVVLHDLGVVLRNRGRSHAIRWQATPPSAWGQPFVAMGTFQQPLLSRHPGRWRDWNGEWYALLPHVDVARVSRQMGIDLPLRQGGGALRLWADVRRGRMEQVLVDTALVRLHGAFATDLPVLSLSRMQGRLGAQFLKGETRYSARSLALVTTREERATVGNLVLMLRDPGVRGIRGGTFHGEGIDLAGMARLVPHLPVDAQVRTAIAQYQPQGLLHTLDAYWEGTAERWTRYGAQGKLRATKWAAASGWPGWQGADFDVYLDQDAGRVGVSMAAGRILAPGVLPDGEVAVERLNGQARWRVTGNHLLVQVDDLTFANADAQGQARMRWETGGGATPTPAARLPGVLDLYATLSRADGKQVHRYLPLVIPQEARDYVRNAVQEARSSHVEFRVRGPLDKLPRFHAGEGVFRVRAQVENATFAYVPTAFQPSGTLPWPVLRGLQGELEIDGMRLQVRNATARVGDALQARGIDVGIADLEHPQVRVHAALRGPATQWLRTVRASPLDGLTAGVLQQATASADLAGEFDLTIDPAAPHDAQLRAALTFAGNELQLLPTLPRLQQLRGRLTFTESGLSVAGIQAHALGGTVRFEGGMHLSDGPMPHNTPTTVRVAGTATAEGLRKATELGPVSKLARWARGTAGYVLSLGMRQGKLEWQLTTPLRGMALTLPAPLAKAAESSLGVQYRVSATGAKSTLERTSIFVGTQLRAWIEHDAASARRGVIEVGAQPGEAPPAPHVGIGIHIHLPQVDIDAWQDVLAQCGADPAEEATAYLPSVVALHSNTVRFGNRDFRKVMLRATRAGALWKATLEAEEAAGIVEYLPPGAPGMQAGRVLARLERLALSPGATRDVENLLANPPQSIPALDVTVDAFSWRGKPLGKLEVQATNRAVPAPAKGATQREWRLALLRLTLPEASFAASGSWVARGSNRTTLDFTLDLADSGALLRRFGMHDVVAGGKGHLRGTVGWVGSPMQPDYGTMDGAVAIDVSSGQFLQAEPGVAKLLGVLSLQSLPRRLTLDFRDVFRKGFAFDFVRGNATLDKGIASTRNLVMKGVNAAVLMEGSADIEHETQDIQVVVIPEINAGTASLLASMINPAIGLGTLLAQVFLRGPLIKSATQEFRVRGSWADPEVTQVPRSTETPTP
ncbi:YhdP family protein [Candidatus Symbiobacter mobilis]|uniref:YhdP central domain-containing protein n=1 Tax=Candidatus Symbiobacter mobilis CR TaxID=946483 RepID=U5N9F3_9BURK|nr:YhdP family protein [Candidatus Symbiobacter mobilis]AGX87940.1 hypothetical protein Cenrod_1859 [Candidatus Symbiobacter mobilis CR]